MTVQRDIAARYCRLKGGKYTKQSITGGAAAVAFTCEKNAVAVNVAAGDKPVRVRFDGAATATDGWPLAAGEKLGWVEIRGAVAMKVFAADTTAIDIWQILDEP